MPSDRSPESLALSRPATGGVTAVEALIGAAILTATAFRLRDEDALIAQLRGLVEAVDVFTDEAEGAGEGEGLDAVLALAAE